MVRIGFIGGGNMGEAVIAGIHKAYRVCVCEQDKRKAARLKRLYHVVLCDIGCLAGECDVIILAVKPQDMEAAVNTLGRQLCRKILVISIAAGITTRFLEKRLPAGARLVRAMPNMPAQIKMGMTGISKGSRASVRDMTLARRIFGSIGRVLVVEEKMMDALTAVSGSGPAYLFYVAECLTKAAAALGFSPDQAGELVRQTLIGSAGQLAASKESAAALRAKVTSRGGTTEAALKVLSAAEVEKIFKDALGAAKRRGRELAR